MQLFVRCGGLHGSVVVDAPASTTIAAVKASLCSKYPDLITTSSNMVLFARGRVLHDTTTVGRAHLVSGTTLDAQLRMRGGGGDGGATGAESRDSYLEMYREKKKDKVNPIEEKLAKYTTCHLSGELLSPPCCCDDLGNLFNKDAVVRALLSKTLPKQLSHITGLKSLTSLVLEPAHSGGTKETRPKSHSDYQPTNGADFVCPVSGVPLNGRYRFVVVRGTGHVVSDKAIKEARDAVQDVVGAKGDLKDVIPLNPEGEELDALKQQALLKLAAIRAKKAAKRAANGEVEQGGNGQVAGHQALAKKLKGGVYPVESAVFASIFRDPTKEEPKETYLCRANAARGMKLG